IGIVYAMFNGTMNQVNEAIFESANDAVTLSIGLISVLVFWLGIMKVAEEAGILQLLAKLFKPIVIKIFPELPKDHPAIGYILSNITDRKSTRLNSSHVSISYAVFCLKKKI